MAKKIIPLQISNENTIYIELKKSENVEEDIASKIFSFDAIKETLSDLSENLILALKKANPHKISVELGVEFSLESGKLITILAKGNLNSTFKITLEWEQAKTKDSSN